MQVLVKVLKYKYKYIWKFKLSHINLIDSFSFSPASPFLLLHQDFCMTGGWEQPFSSL